MLWSIVAVLITLWLLGFLLDVAGSAIHLLAVIALGVIIYNFVRSKLG